MKAYCKIFNYDITTPELRAEAERAVCYYIDKIKPDVISGTLKATWLGPYQYAHALFLTCVIEWCEE